MSRVIIGMDPHKRSATIEIMAGDQAILGAGRYATDTAGYRAMLAKGKHWPERAFDGARVAAVAAERIGALDDFSDCLGASEGKRLGGKAA